MQRKTSVFDIIPLFGRRSPEKKTPRHIAINSDDIIVWMKKNKVGSIKDACIRKNKVIMSLASFQADRNIPIFTVLALDDRKHLPEEIEAIHKLFFSLKSAGFIHKNQVKISVLGKWYDLPGYVVEEIKHAIENTKDYDRFFFNLCINYSGQEEIADSCRLIARKVAAGKADISAINAEMIKENLYSSYFIPPDLLIKAGTRKSWPNLLLWDIPGAHYFFSGKLFNDMTEKDIEEAVEDFNR